MQRNIGGEGSLEMKLIRLGFVFICMFSVHFVHSQPTPGDSGLGAASGQVVGAGGGGADLHSSLGIVFTCVVLYLLFKFRDWFWSVFFIKKWLYNTDHTATMK